MVGQGILRGLDRFSPSQTGRDGRLGGWVALPQACDGVPASLVLNN